MCNNIFETIRRIGFINQKLTRHKCFRGELHRFQIWLKGFIFASVANLIMIFNLFFGYLELIKKHCMKEINLELGYISCIITWFLYDKARFDIIVRFAIIDRMSVYHLIAWNDYCKLLSNASQYLPIHARSHQKKRFNDRKICTAIFTLQCTIWHVLLLSEWHSLICTFYHEMNSIFNRQNLMLVFIKCIRIF